MNEKYMNSGVLQRGP